MHDNPQFAKELFRQTGVRLSFMHADKIRFARNWCNGEGGFMRRGRSTE
jgi:hypothetical protein